MLSGITDREMIGIPNLWLFWSLAVVVVVITFGSYSSNVKDKRKFTLWTLLIEYVLIVFCATVICRASNPSHRIALLPFWIYIEVLNGNPRVTPLDILFNILLLFPIGVLLAGVLPKIKLWHVFGIGLLLSLTIETLQYVLYKGVAQFDDLVHNSLGCVLGWYLIKRIIQKKLV